MAQPMPGGILYFLGINGEQTGPYSESDVLQKIARNEVPADTLIWYDGLPEWQPVKSIAVFQRAIENPGEKPPPPSSSVGGAFKPLSHVDEPNTAKANTPTQVPASSMNVLSAAEPVFNVGEASFSQEGKIKQKAFVLVAGVALLGLGAAGYFFFWANTEEAPPPPKVAESKPISERETKLRKALSELLINPPESVAVLRGIIKENAKDPLGQQAVTALVEYYAVQKPVEAGRLYLELKEPWEAIPFFQKDPPSNTDLEIAYGIAYESSTDVAKKKLALLEQIKLLLGPVKNKNKAIERIQLFEKTFPGEAHPYRYYLKNTEEKIQDLFHRISFFYVSTLMGFLNTEMKQINLEKKPLVELKKEKDGKFRIVASYAGDILLNRDKLNKIFFQFWLVKDSWVIVDTNLTAERQKFTRGEREKYLGTSLPPEEMLSALENVFAAQFPKTPLHETPVAVKKRDPE